MRFAGLVPASLVDYPGHVAVTLFTAGCPLRCPYCHNPELVVGPLSGRPLPADDVLAFLQRRRPLLSHLCVTGGEPTLHRDLPEFLAAVRHLGYAIKLDTNGGSPDALVGLLRAGLCDYVAMDVKTVWDRYPELGGAVDPAAHRRSALAIRALAPDYEFRTTVVPGLVGHDDVRTIATDLAGARRYALQQFDPARPLLDPDWKAVRPVPAAVLRAWADEVAPYFVEPVIVRNLGVWV